MTKTSKKKGKAAPKEDAKSGLSFGSLSGYHSLLESLHPSVTSLIIEMDCIFGSESVALDLRQELWRKHYFDTVFPAVGEWPTKPLLPKSHLFGTGIFDKKKQTEEVQYTIITRMVFLWARGVGIVGRGAGQEPLLRATSLCANTVAAMPMFTQFVTLRKAWSVSDEFDRALADFKADEQKLIEFAAKHTVSQAKARAVGMDMEKDDGGDEENKADGVYPVVGYVASEMDHLLKLEIQASIVGFNEIQYIDTSFRTNYSSLYAEAHEALMMYPWIRDVGPDEAATCNMRSVYNIRSRTRIDSSRNMRPVSLGRVYLRVEEDSP